MNATFDPDDDLYAVLGVQPSATEEEIQSAYRRLAKRLHPDVNEDKVSAEREFKRVEQAYATLRDALKRRDYDNARSPKATPQPVVEQYFTCPRCQTPNIVPSEGLQVDAQCGSCGGFLLQPANRPVPLNSLGVRPASYQPEVRPVPNQPSTSLPKVVDRQPTKRGAPKKRYTYFAPGWWVFPIAVLVAGVIRSNGCMRGNDTSAGRQTVALSTKQEVNSLILPGTWELTHVFHRHNKPSGVLKIWLNLERNGQYSISGRLSASTGHEANWTESSGYWQLSDRTLVFSQPILLPCLVDDELQGTDQMMAKVLDFADHEMQLQYGEMKQKVTLQRIRH